MMIRTLRPWLLVITLVAGCEADAPTPPGEPPADTTTYAPTRTDTLYVEGTPAPIEMPLYDEAALPFVTYLPPGDFVAQHTETPEGHGVRFTANFGGVESPDAYAEFFFPLDDELAESMETLAAYAQEEVERNEWTLVAGETRCPWATQQFRFEDDTGPAPATGYVCLGTHAGEPFYLLVHYPREYAEGFGPRLDAALDAFRWRDDGQGLR